MLMYKSIENVRKLWNLGYEILEWRHKVSFSAKKSKAGVFSLLLKSNKRKPLSKISKVLPWDTNASSFENATISQGDYEYHNEMQIFEYVVQNGYNLIMNDLNRHLYSPQNLRFLQISISLESRKPSRIGQWWSSWFLSSLKLSNRSLWLK